MKAKRKKKKVKTKSDVTIKMKKQLWNVGKHLDDKINYN